MIAAAESPERPPQGFRIQGLHRMLISGFGLRLHFQSRLPHRIAGPKPVGFCVKKSFRIHIYDQIDRY
jgi:hypothetical protein